MRLLCLSSVCACGFAWWEYPAPGSRFYIGLRFLRGARAQEICLFDFSGVSKRSAISHSIRVPLLYIVTSHWYWGYLHHRHHPRSLSFEGKTHDPLFLIKKTIHVLIFEKALLPRSFVHFILSSHSTQYHYISLPTPTNYLSYILLPLPLPLQYLALGSCITERKRFISSKPLKSDA